MNVHGCISVKLHLLPLKFKFHTIFIHHKILFFLSLIVSHLQMAETTLGSQIIQKQRGGWIWPMGPSLAGPEREDASSTRSVFHGHGGDIGHQLCGRSTAELPGLGSGSCDGGSALPAPSPGATYWTTVSTPRAVKGSILANVQCSFTHRPKGPGSGTHGPGLWAGNENR